jgi:hypothetical protein
MTISVSISNIEFCDCKTFVKLWMTSSHRIDGGRRAHDVGIQADGCGCGFSAIEVPPMSFLQRGLTREEQLVTAHFRCCDE